MIVWENLKTVFTKSLYSRTIDLYTSLTVLLKNLLIFKNLIISEEFFLYPNFTKVLWTGCKHPRGSDSLRNCSNTIPPRLSVLISDYQCNVLISVINFTNCKQANKIYINPKRNFKGKELLYWPNKDLSN